MRERTTRSLRAVMVMFLLVLVAPKAVVLYGQESHTGQSTAFTIEGNAALWTVAIKPDRTQDFESIMTKLRDALRKSEKAERQQQAAGWKLLKVEKPMPDGNIVYVHVINPVVRGADYTILRILYDEFPDERQALYEQYRSAFVKSLSLASGAIVLDLAQAP